LLGNKQRPLIIRQTMLGGLELKELCLKGFVLMGYVALDILA
jgi:hypothetical protein